MHTKKQQVDVADLAVGMYVCELDRPWLETPFLMQGFLIESEAEIATLAQYCRYVYIDVEQGKTNGNVVHAFRQPPPRQAPQKKKPRPTPKSVSTAEILSLRPQRRYRDTVAWDQEIGRAQEAVAGLTVTVKDMFETLYRDGKYQFTKLKQSVTPLVNSIERNPDACVWLARLKNRDSYIYKHSVATSIWAVALGRELALPPPDLKSLAIGALMLDVGKLRIPRKLLAKTDSLTQKERMQLREHVNYSLEALKESNLFSQEVWDMVAYHHERYDGSGYPIGMVGDEIPLFARIAGLVDSYDAMTSHRYHREPVSPSSAIRTLYKERDKQYDGILVEELIQAIGLYPAGTLVLLSTGEVAIVLAEGRTRRLKPQVLLLLDKNKQPVQEERVVNLADELCPDSGEPVTIVQSLEPGSFGVDPEKVSYQPA